MRQVRRSIPGGGRKTVRWLLAMLVVLLFPEAGIAREGKKDYIEVEIRYRSLFPGYLQIRNEVCKPSRGIECEKTAIKLKTKECLQQNPPSACEEAAELLQFSSCVAGLIYDDRVGREEKIRVSLCTSLSGFGNASVRDVKNGAVWTNYPLLNDGDTITYP